MVPGRTVVVISFDGIRGNSLRGTRIWRSFASKANGCWATDTPGFHRKGLFKQFWEVENSNLRSVSLETPLFDQEPMKIEFAGNMFAEVFRCGEHECIVQTPWKAMVHRKLIEFELAGKFLPIFDWKKNWSPVFTCGIGRGLERVDTGVTKTNREWRPDGAPTND